VSVDAYAAGQIVAVVFAVGAAIADVRFGDIPNALTLPTLAIAVIGYGFLGGFAAAGLAIGGGAAAALFPLLLFRAGALGGGDVKALAVVGTLLGPGPGLEAEVTCFVVVMATHFIGSVRSRMVLEDAKRASRLLWRRPDEGDDSAFSRARIGPALLVGTLVAIALLNR
jgi:prepilin peptidase CpaA